MRLTKTFKFEASHVLPNHPGKCSNLHGHSWVLTVEVSGPVDKDTGMVDDYHNISNAVNPIVEELDHAHLGAWQSPLINIQHGLEGQTKWVEWLDTPGFNPTSENLLVAIAKQLFKRGFVFSSLTLNETCTTSCTLTWEEFNKLGAAPPAASPQPVDIRESVLRRIKEIQAMEFQKDAYCEYTDRERWQLAMGELQWVERMFERAASGSGTATPANTKELAGRITERIMREVYGLYLLTADEETKEKASAPVRAIIEEELR